MQYDKVVIQNQCNGDLSRKICLTAVCRFKHPLISIK